MKIHFSKQKIGWVLLALILLFAACLRLWRLETLPGGIDQDEAYAGYEAYSLLRTGHDTWGNRFPVYLIAWGSGMNVLYTMLSIPFVAVFGLCKLAIRLPQAILGTVTVLNVYLIGREAINEKFGLTAAVFLAVVPWHVMLSRWGLESNLLVFFCTLGLLLLLKSFRNDKWLIPAAIVYGLALYAYAVSWVVLPILLLMTGVYAIRNHFWRLRTVLISMVILFLFALPLLLSLMVNKGWIEPITTPLFSIPRMLYLRDGEYTLAGLKDRLRDVYKLMITQSDGMTKNSLPNAGILYHFGMLFAAMGAVMMPSEIRKNERSKSFCVLILMSIAVALPSLLLLDVSINEVNYLFVPLALAAAFFMYRIGSVKKALAVFFTGLILVSFLIFGRTYYSGEFSFLNTGIEEAWAYAKTLDKPVTAVQISHSVVLMLDQTDPEGLPEEIEYEGSNPAYSFAVRIRDIELTSECREADRNRVYIGVYGDALLCETMKQAGFKRENFGNCVVFFRQEESLSAAQDPAM